MKVEFDLSNCAKKADLKGALGIDISMMASEICLAGLQTVDNLDIDKIMTVPSELRRLSSVVENDVIKKIVYDKLVMLIKR